MKCGCRHVKERDAPPLEQIDKERENPPPLVGAGVPDRPGTGFVFAQAWL